MLNSVTNRCNLKSLATHCHFQKVCMSNMVICSDLVSLVAYLVSSHFRSSFWDVTLGWVRLSKGKWLTRRVRALQGLDIGEKLLWKCEETQYATKTTRSICSLLKTFAYSILKSLSKVYQSFSTRINLHLRFNKFLSVYFAQINKYNKNDNSKIEAQENLMVK